MIVDKDLHVLNRKVDYGIVGKKKLLKLLSFCTLPVIFHSKKT